jgi:hypothetical protein
LCFHSLIGFALARIAKLLDGDTTGTIKYYTLGGWRLRIKSAAFSAIMMPAVFRMVIWPDASSA